jgi:hypothetical protein
MVCNTNSHQQTYVKEFSMFTLISKNTRRRPLDWERARANLMFPMRIAIALLLLTMSVVIVAAHDGHPWGAWLFLLATIPGMLAHLFIAYHIWPSTIRQ